MSSAPRPLPVRVAVLAFDGCMSSAVAGLLEAFQIANQWARRAKLGPIFEASVLAASAKPVLGSGGITLPARPPAPGEAIDVAIVPPILGSVPGTLADNAALVTWLRARSDGLVASVCTGAFFLAEAGLLRGRRATTHPNYADAFRRAYGDVELVPQERLADEGAVLTAGSTTAFLDLAIYLIDRFAGHEIAVQTAKSLSIDKNRRSQLPYFLYAAPRDHGDDAVLAAQAWLEERFAEPFSAAQLARHAAMSLRSLNRRFRSATGRTPLEYLHRVRIEAAKRLLETSRATVDQITSRVGYADARSFSRLFRSVTSLSPREYRQRFGRP